MVGRDTEIVRDSGGERWRVVESEGERYERDGVRWGERGIERGMERGG